MTQTKKPRPKAQTSHNRIAQVFYNQRLAGILAETPEGFQFTYDDDYLAGGTPIAFTFPLQESAFDFLNQTTVARKALYLRKLR
ncbi:MAG: HipA N-terminal domain-containing protein [Exilibacterium sp.]